MSTITVETILEAEKLLGLGYSEAERALMVENVAAQVELAVKRRATKLPLTLAPATLFDPRLPGFAMPPERGFRPSEAAAPPLADEDEDIAFAPVTTLAAWIRTGAI